MTAHKEIEREALTKALRLAYSLGQTYWQQADSESYSQNKKADITKAKFEALIVESCAALAARSQPSEAGWKRVPIEATKEMQVAAIKCMNGPAVYKVVATKALEIEEGIYAGVYEAMLAASPREAGT